MSDFPASTWRQTLEEHPEALIAMIRALASSDLLMTTSVTLSLYAKDEPTLTISFTPPGEFDEDEGQD